MRSVFLSFLIGFLLSFALKVFSGVQGKATPTHLIKDPRLDTRCKSLLETRNEKLDMKQRTLSLIRRNAAMIRKAPAHRESLSQRLTKLEHYLNRELNLVSMKLQILEEDIVRKGCPGISLN